MKRPRILFVCAVMLFAVPLCGTGCVNLEVGGQGGTTASAESSAADEGEVASQSAASLAVQTTATLPPMSTSTTVDAPATTTTDSGGDLQLDDLVVQAPPSIAQIQPGPLPQMDLNKLEAPRRYEETHPDLLWVSESAWRVTHIPVCSGGSAMTSYRRNSWMEASFRGTGVALISNEGPNWGRLVVRLTGTGISMEEEIDLYSDQNEFRKQVWYSGYLAEGHYTLRLSYSNANIGDTVILVDALDVWGNVTPP